MIILGAFAMVSGVTSWVVRRTHRTRPSRLTNWIGALVVVGMLCAITAMWAGQIPLETCVVILF